MKVKINYPKELFRGHSGLCESVFCAPFEEPLKFTEEKFENGRFLELITKGSDYLEFTSLLDCDYFIIPYKWDWSDISFSLIEKAKKIGKKTILLYNDDNPPLRVLSEEDGFLFTTTLIKNQRKSNEFTLPAFTGDFYQSENFNTNRVLGFCGAITHPIRNIILSKIYQSSNLQKDFIIRSGFWAPEMTKDEARVGYFKNMIDTTFTICIRGAGNFSYRLYETTMMGRIPIIIDTEQVFPFEDIIDYSKFSLKIDYKNLDNLENIIFNFVSELTDDKIIEMQKLSRQTWLEYFSPLGWIKNFTKEIKHVW